MNQHNKISYKSIYTDFYLRSNKKYPLPNGLPKNVLTLLKQKLETNNEKSIEDYETVRFPFNHGDFYHYFYSLCGENSILFLDDITEDTIDDSIYVFPLEIKTTLESLRTDINCVFDNTTYTYNVISELPDKVIRLLQNKKIYLLITMIQDPIFEEDALCTVDILKKYGIDSDRIHIISAREANLLGSNAKVHRGIIPLVKIANDIESQPKIGGLGYVSEYVGIKDLNTSTIRKNKFLSFNRTARDHRIWLLSTLLKHNILSDGLFSFIFPELRANSIIPNIRKLLPYELDTHHLPIYNKGAFPTNNNKKEFYQDSYIHIVTETSFREPNVCFTEKIFRPIANLQPFIVIGNSFSLKELRELGFKTFHPLINEEYDTVVDPSKRLSLIEEELLRLSKMNLKEVHTLYYSLENVLVHNKNHLITYKDDNPFHIPLQNMKTTILRGQHGI